MACDVRNAPLDPVESRKGVYQLLNLVDGGSLVDLAKKGNLVYVERLYNPGNFFKTVYHLVFRKRDLSVPVHNHTIRPLLLKSIRHVPKIDFLLSLVYYVVQTVHITRRCHVHAIRARGPYLAGLLSIVAGKLSRIPVVVSLGGNNRLAQELEGEYFLHNRLLSYKWEEFVLRQADKVFCPNEFTRSYVMKLGVKEDRAAIVPLLLPDHVFHHKGSRLRARANLRWRDQPIVLAVSRLTPYKQVDVLVETIPLVLKSAPEAKFLFVGDGYSRGTLETRCKELGITNSVRFVGFQPSGEVANYLAAATLVWIPMSGFVVYEAAAAEKPIVAFDVEWHKEFIENGVTGILVRNRDRTELAEAVVNLLSSPSRAQELGRNAKAKLLHQYEPNRLIALEANAYVSIIERQHNDLGI